jgi:uncharacterized membrane protein YdfJ with MMPL/SSD domain
MAHLAPSQFVIISQLGLLVAIDMLTISFSALTFLPACIKLLPPRLPRRATAATVSEIPLKLATEQKQPGGKYLSHDRVMEQGDAEYKEVS